MLLLVHEKHLYFINSALSPRFPSSQVVSVTSTPVTATEATTHTLKLTGGAIRFLHPFFTHPSLFFTLMFLPFSTLLSAPHLSPLLH